MRTNFTHANTIQDSKPNGSRLVSPRTMTALVVLLPLLGAGALDAQSRPTPGQGLCLLGTGDGCSTSGGSTSGGTTGAGGGTTGSTGGIRPGYPDLNLLRQGLRQTDEDLYRLWLDRERARYSWQITGLSTEAQRFNQAEAAIEAVQRQNITALHDYCAQYKQALINDFMSNPANQANRAQWEQAIQEVQQYYSQQYQQYRALNGLRQDKFAHLPQTVLLDPHTDPAITSWLTWLHTPY
jgi:hypothetical protein